MRHASILCWLAVALSACSSVGGTPPTTPDPGMQLPETPGEQATHFGYVPVDPLAVNDTVHPGTCSATAGDDGAVRPARSLLDDLPDLAVRYAVAEVTAQGSLSFGVGQVAAAGTSYRAILDYVNVDVVPVDLYLRKLVNDGSGQPVERRLFGDVGENEHVVGFEARMREPALAEAAARILDAFDPSGGQAQPTEDELKRDAHLELVGGDQYTEVTIPVYVGVGMRLSADLRADSAGASLSSLGVIGAEARAGRLSGTLTVQTLGITGQPIATALPLPSRLDQTTVENGILALGSTRAVLYNHDDSGPEVTTTPRVVGLYSPVGTNPGLINAIYSELSRVRPAWGRSCVPSPTT